MAFSERIKGATYSGGGNLMNFHKKIEGKAIYLNEDIN